MLLNPKLNMQNVKAANGQFNQLLDSVERKESLMGLAAQFRGNGAVDPCFAQTQ